MKTLFFKANQQLRKARRAEKGAEATINQEITLADNPIRERRQQQQQQQELQHSTTNGYPNSARPVDSKSPSKSYDIEYSINYSGGLNKNWHPNEDFFKMELAKLISSISSHRSYCGVEFHLHTCATSFVRYVRFSDEKAFSILRRSFLHFIEQSIHQKIESQPLFFIIIEPQLEYDLTK